MKILHLADLHFGKTLYNVTLTEKDQPAWINELIKKIDDEKIDVVMISGDVYDRQDPSPEAMALYEKLINELSSRKVKVFITPGNHDNATRLSFMKDILKENQVFVARKAGKEIEHYDIEENGQIITFWLLPYVYPKEIRRLLADENGNEPENCSLYDEAVRALISVQNIDSSHVNILLSHQNVLAGDKKPEHSDSEISIGGIGEIDYTVFDPFDYVALGHIHNAQHIGRETVRYAGCPLYYDFSEVKRNKALTVLNVKENKEICIERVEIPLLHSMLIVEGTFDELKEKADALSEKDKENNYILAVLKGTGFPQGVKDILQNKFGNNLLNVKRDVAGAVSIGIGDGVVPRETAVSDTDKYAQYFAAVNAGEPISDDQIAVFEKVLEAVVNNGTKEKIPEVETQELFEFLENYVKENDHETA